MLDVFYRKHCRIAHVKRWTELRPTTHALFILVKVLLINKENGERETDLIRLGRNHLALQGLHHAAQNHPTSLWVSFG